MIRTQLSGLLLFIGLILAASDGAWFPFANLLGVLLAYLASFFLYRLSRSNATRPGPWRA